MMPSKWMGVFSCTRRQKREHLRRSFIAYKLYTVYCNKKDTYCCAKTNLQTLKQTSITSDSVKEPSAEVMLCLCLYWLDFNPSLSLTHACVNSYSRVFPRTRLFCFHSPHILVRSFSEERTSHFPITLPESSGSESRMWSPNRTCQRWGREITIRQRSNQTPLVWM